MTFACCNDCSAPKLQAGTPRGKLPTRIPNPSWNSFAIFVNPQKINPESILDNKLIWILTRPKYIEPGHLKMMRIHHEFANLLESASPKS